jgi:uncharacterized membrane protein YvbJ
MFCPSCGRQNKDDVLFCEYCGKAMPQKYPAKPSVQPAIQAVPSSLRAPASKGRLSFTALKAVVTVVLIVIVAIIVLQIYYPGALPW